MSYDRWKTRSPDDDIQGEPEPSYEEQLTDYLDAQQRGLIPWTCKCRQPGLGGDCDGSCQFPPPQEKPRIRVAARSYRITWAQYALNYMDPKPASNPVTPAERR